MDLLNGFATIIEIALRVVLAVGLTGAIVWALAVWMQNNPTLSARREQQNRDAMKARIAREVASQKR